MENKTDAQLAVEHLVSIGRSSTEFVLELADQHRTHQQAVTGLMVAWFQHLAKLSSNQYDLRNEAAVEFAKEMMLSMPVSMTQQRFPII